MEADYIIVGAGSAGCVLANRLSADDGASVLLLEAGPENDALTLKMPAAMAANLNSTRHNWAFEGESEPGLGDRRLRHDRGKTLGGSSSINGMVFIRGHARDFDGWRQLGCEGWSYAEVLPYFKRLETYSGGGDEFRGADGPLNIHRPNPANPITRAFLLAGEQAGYPVTDDICGFRQEGFGTLDRTTYNGERWSTARAYLEPVRRRSNLTVLTRTHVQKIVFDGRRAIKVSFTDGHGQRAEVAARREILICAGAIGTPSILMHSGIGPANNLRRVGIEVVADRPGVGANLNEHPDFVLKYGCRRPVSIWPKTRMIGKTLAGLRWLTSRSGVCASNHFEAVACIRSGPGVDYPDLQLCIAPFALKEDSWETIPAHAFQIHVGLMRAYSRGSVALRDGDPASPPRIIVNYLEDPRDLKRLRDGIRHAREIVNQPAFDTLRGDEIFPGAAAGTDKELDNWLRRAVNTQWHLSGTAKMGPASDPNAVVDPGGRVYGVLGLRVVDASIMPQVTNGNTNSPTIMIAEKLSDAILGGPPLPRAETAIWQNPDWETRQR